MAEKSFNRIEDQLFATSGEKVYAVLDGASVEGLLHELAAHRPENVCLYRGELEASLAHAAPYLVQIEQDTDFADWVLDKGWGEHWGVFAVSSANLREMRLHFRRFLKVKSPEGKTLYFRYYDPRVLRAYLPTCNAEESETLFGPISSYLMEDEDPSVLLRATRNNGSVSMASFPLGDQAPVR